MRSLLVCSLLMSVTVSVHARNGATEDVENISSSRALVLDDAFSSLLKKHKINTAGIAVIKNGRVHWQNQYGNQSTGVPASAHTLYNVASITKTVTTQTILRLVADGKLSLDESISAYWVDPDLKDDPNHQKLTARMLLTHTSGLPNWRFLTEGFKLKFVNPPGTKFGYSGEGFQYLMRYAEGKMGRPFEDLVRTYVFDPLHMLDVSVSVRQKNFPRIAQSLDENQKFYGYYCRPEGYCREEGSVSAAGDMVITVADYAKFLIAAMDDTRLSSALKQERDNIQVTSYAIDCSQSPDVLCPSRLGYGLGWNVTQLGNDKLIGHAGSDWASVTLAYYYQNSRDGLIIFLNAPNKAGLAGMVAALELLDPDSPKLHEYRARVARDN